MPDTHSYSTFPRKRESITELILTMVKKLLFLGIKAYQRISRALLFSNCRFYPSCSQYALEAIERFGIARGVKKAVCRILRCSPMTDGGHDPVRPNL